MNPGYARTILAVLLLLHGFVDQAFAENEKSRPRSFALIKSGAEAGDANEQYELGDCYLTGAGTAKDSIEAVKWLRKAADQNNAEAQGLLGYCYAAGDGVTRDATEAVKWFRKAAEQEVAKAQGALGSAYFYGDGVTKNDVEAVKWYRKAAEQGVPEAQRDLGNRYLRGEGVKKDEAEAVRWYRKSVDQGFSGGQLCLGLCYFDGLGVMQNRIEATKLFLKAAEQGEAQAQYLLGWCYANGEGVPKNDIEGYKWCLIATSGGNKEAKRLVAILENRMSREEVVQGQGLAEKFKPHRNDGGGNVNGDHPRSSGTGFFITEDGYLVTNAHVVAGGRRVELLTGSGITAAKVVRVDGANDLALLKASGTFKALPVAGSRNVRLGDLVLTVGFPNIDLQGFAPKFARGEIASLSGPRDDPRYFQISVALQPGNSGGALVDEHGNVVGVVSAKLNARATLLASGELPENVNYAVKGSFLLSFLESIPDVAARVMGPNSSDLKVEGVAERAKDCSVLVIVY